MSLQTMSWAFSLKGVTPLAKLVAIYLADYEDEGPPLNTIAEWCGVTEDEARTALTELCALERRLA
jgi:hypothetical protein